MKRVMVHRENHQKLGGSGSGSVSMRTLVPQVECELLFLGCLSGPCWPRALHADGTAVPWEPDLTVTGATAEADFFSLP